MQTRFYLSNLIIAICFIFSVSNAHGKGISRQSDSIEIKVDSLLQRMSLADKVGQLQLINSPGGDNMKDLEAIIRNGGAGGVLNEVRPEVVLKLQKIAVEESKHGIPLLFGRDVIHGFKTILPINIGMAATFNPELIQHGALISAREARSAGVNWNFAPMVDVARDPRWGRMAESFGEDPLLITEMGLAMLQGFHGNDPGSAYLMAACAKHFAGYGAAEGGRDYNTTSIPEVELWNVYFPPFKALTEAGVSSFMTGFNELNGIPASGNEFLLRDILKDKWDFNGFVVSDWASVAELKTHGYAGSDKEAAAKAFKAGVDMEMATTTYRDHLPALIKSGEISEDVLNDAVRRILRVKFQLGLFDDPYVDLDEVIKDPPQHHFDMAKKVAEQSLVLLKNDDNTLPLSKDISRLALIGPMTNDRYEQLGTWIFDGDTNLSITPLMAFQEKLGKNRIHYAKGLITTRSMSNEGFDAAIEEAKNSDAIIFFAGEESIITGEAHSRAYLHLPGLQEDLIRKISETGKPLILVIMTPRPLAIGEIQQYADAVIYAWHPGTMGGPAIADIVFGERSPSGKLPVTFPITAGQIPIYYAHKNTGRPAVDESFTQMQDIPVRSFQTSVGNTSNYLDIGFRPLYPFGFGLSYTSFDYSDLSIADSNISLNDTLNISVNVSNTGEYPGDEIVQLYVRDLVASVTRPVKELKDFTRINLEPGQTKHVNFHLPVDDLGFYNKHGEYITEPGQFQIWVGGSSDSGLSSMFNVRK